jgi:hypothetical protein
MLTYAGREAAEVDFAADAGVQAEESIRSVCRRKRIERMRVIRRHDACLRVRRMLKY